MRVLRMGMVIPATVVVLLLAWVGASNHCGLAMLQALHQAESSSHSCCHQPDAAPTPDDRMVACCDALNVPLPTVVAAPVGEWSVILPVWPGCRSDFGVSDQTAPLVSAYDSSPPPRVESFSELVLSRSLRAHAPPLS